MPVSQDALFSAWRKRGPPGPASIKRNGAVLFFIFFINSPSLSLCLKFSQDFRGDSLLTIRRRFWFPINRIGEFGFRRRIRVSWSFLWSPWQNLANQTVPIAGANTWSPIWVAGNRVLGNWLLNSMVWRWETKPLPRRLSHQRARSLTLHHLLLLMHPWGSFAGHRLASVAPICGRLPLFFFILRFLFAILSLLINFSSLRKRCLRRDSCLVG